MLRIFNLPEKDCSAQQQGKNEYFTIKNSQMIVVILVILLVIVIFFYASSSLEHLFHSARVAGRMFVVIAFVILVLGLMLYSYLVS